MYYFIIEKETNNIVCKSLETNETIVTAINSYEKDCEDFWTSVEIDGELFDINIYYENEYSPSIISHDENDKPLIVLNGELIKENIPTSLQLYKILKDDEGVYTTDCADFVSYGLTFEK